MPRELFTADEVTRLINVMRERDQAHVAHLGSDRPQEVISLTIDLATARSEFDPMKIGFPFKTVYVEDATDTSANVHMRLISRDAKESSFKLKRNDGWESDFSINEAYLHWAAQTGKELTLKFFVNSRFRSGSLQSVNSGGVSISEGSTIETLANVGVTSTAGIVAPANSDRKLCIIQNLSTEDLYFGDANVVVSTGAANKVGFKVLPDGLIEWRNTAALYGIKSGAGTAYCSVQELE